MDLRSNGASCLHLVQPWPSTHSGDPAKVYQRFGPRLNLKNSLRHFAKPSSKFYGGQKPQIFVLIFDTTRI